METKEITPAQYAKYRGFSPQYVHKILKDGKLELMPEVQEIKKYSRFYVLVVPDTISENSFINLKPKKQRK